MELEQIFLEQPLFSDRYQNTADNSLPEHVSFTFYLQQKNLFLPSTFYAIDQFRKKLSCVFQDLVLWLHGKKCLGA